MSAQLGDLGKEYHERAYTDPVFYAQIRQTERVLEELDKMGALHGNKSYAALLVCAALDRVLPHSVEVEAWERGFSAATREWMAYMANARHQMVRKNPYKP